MFGLKSADRSHQDLFRLHHLLEPRVHEAELAGLDHHHLALLELLAGGHQLLPVEAGDLGAPLAHQVVVVAAELVGQVVAS